MKYEFAKQKGFSLVETLVAVTILLLIIVGPMTISSSVARSTSFSSEQVTAFFLAQEGAELAQKARDDLLLANFNDVDGAQTAWEAFTVNNIMSNPYWFCFNSTQGCAINLIGSSNIGAIDYSYQSGSPYLLGCYSMDTCKLYYNPNGERARYTHRSTTSGIPNQVTPYSRAVKFELVDPNQVKVTSKVTWQTTGQRKQQEVEVITYLFNVYGN